MKTIKLKSTADADGIIRLEIPVGEAGVEFEIAVRQVPPKEWLPGFWETLREGWQGEKLVRPPQCMYCGH